MDNTFINTIPVKPPGDEVTLNYDFDFDDDGLRGGGTGTFQINSNTIAVE